MKPLEMRIVIFSVMALVLAGIFATNGLCYDGIADPGAEAAAAEAARNQGAGRVTVFKGHVVGITGGKTVDIVGLKGRQIKGLSVDLKKMLSGLNAKKVGQKIQVSLSSDVLFDFDKWNIKKSAEASLYKLAKALKKLEVKQVLIEGHTDAKGTEKYNLALSRKRADSVKAWLVKKGGVDGSKIITKGYGESRPIAPNTNPDGSDCPEGRAKNRRVEIYVSLLQSP